MTTTYGDIYRYAFYSRNGSDIEIVISKAGYTGAVTTRPLGMAPVLRRENNNNIYGTSLEIYAECREFGEYVQFYTTSAFEYKVTLYRDGRNIWSGYVSPELYSEPDIPVPYDVQIIATDGLGELKLFTFESEGYQTLEDHIKRMLRQAQVVEDIQMISQIKYGLEDNIYSAANDLLKLKLDLSHENGKSCYDVLQNVLASLHAGMTLHDGKWLLFRETDIAYIVSHKGVEGFDNAGNDVLFPIYHFGSSDSNEWWPVGNMTVAVEPAKKSIELTSPFHYRENILKDVAWSLSDGAEYDEDEEAYVIPTEGSSITKRMEFGVDVAYKLSLKIKARNVLSGESGESQDQNIGIKVLIDGRTSGGQRQYWLVKSDSINRGSKSYVWRSVEGQIEELLQAPTQSDTASDAQGIEIVLPLYRAGSRSYTYASSVEVTVYNPAGVYPINVYDVGLAKYEQPDGHILNVKLENGAREYASDVDLSMTDGSLAPESASVTMTGIPMKPSGYLGPIMNWELMSGETGDYLSIMGKDYAISIRSPLLRYTGRLNVPRHPLPVMFKRDTTFYWIKTYDYDLYEDEIGVELVSIPADILAGYQLLYVQEGQFLAADGDFYIVK